MPTPGLRIFPVGEALEKLATIGAPEGRVFKIAINPVTVFLCRSKYFDTFNNSNLNAAKNHTFGLIEKDYFEHPTRRGNKPSAQGKRSGALGIITTSLAVALQGQKRQ